MKDSYIFPAIFHTAADGISIYFPDLPGCLSCANNFELAFERAKESLQLHIFGMEEDGEKIPEPSSVNGIKIKSNEILAMIEVWMPPFREKIFNKSVHKTITIPLWLDKLAKREQINYSQLFQESLKNYLGVNNRI